MMLLRATLRDHLLPNTPWDTRQHMRAACSNAVLAVLNSCESCSKGICEVIVTKVW